MPYATSSATPRTAAAIVMVLRSRGSSTGLCAEREREALVGLAALAEARSRGEKAGVGESRISIERGKDRGRVRRGAVDAPLVADRARVEHGDVARESLAEGREDAERVGPSGSDAPRDGVLVVERRQPGLQCGRRRRPRLDRRLPLGESGED